MTRMVRTRPRRSTTGPPKVRVSASAAANAVTNSAATAAACPWPLRAARVSQLPAEPSPSSTPSMTTPMSSSRPSSQPHSHWRSLAPRSWCGSCAGARRPPGIPAAVPRAAAAMTRASAMNCARQAHHSHRGGDEQQRSRQGPAAAQPLQHRGRREQPERGRNRPPPADQRRAAGPGHGCRHRHAPAGPRRAGAGRAPLPFRRAAERGCRPDSDDTIRLSAEPSRSPRLPGRVAQEPFSPSRRPRRTRQW